MFVIRYFDKKNLQNNDVSIDNLTQCITVTRVYNPSNCYEIQMQYGDSYEICISVMVIRMKMLSSNQHGCKWADAILEKGVKMKSDYIVSFGKVRPKNSHGLLADNSL